MSGLPSRAAMVQLVETADHQAGGREKDHGERELADDERRMERVW